MTKSPFNLNLPITSIARQKLEEARQTQQRDDLPPEYLDWYKEQVQKCEARDERRKQYPRCWCLGQGHVTTDIMKFCSCPEGVAALNKWMEEAPRIIEGKRKALNAFVLQNSGIPERYQDLKIETHPFFEAHPIKTTVVRSVYLHGEIGRGKTGLAVCLAKKFAAVRVREGLGLELPLPTLKFVSVPSLLMQVRGSYGNTESTEWDIMRPYILADILILDDISLGYGVEAWKQDKLFTLINERYNAGRTTLFTSQEDLKGLAPDLGENIRSRIFEMCGGWDGIIEVTGKNLRAI